MYLFTFIVHPQTTNGRPVLYDKAFATNLFQKDVEGMVSLFLARASFERRICLASLEDEQAPDTESSLAGSAVSQPLLEPQDRLPMLLGILNNGIKAIRSGELGIYVRPITHLWSDQWLRVAIHVFVSSASSLRL
jgi:hypothetical protein